MEDLAINIKYGTPISNIHSDGNIYLNCNVSNARKPLYFRLKHGTVGANLSFKDNIDRIKQVYLEDVIVNGFLVVPHYTNVILKGNSTNVKVAIYRSENYPEQDDGKIIIL